MRIIHHPGKAVINDPSWLEMDIPNSARGRQYEANWLDAQRNLSSGSSTNSWDRSSGSSVEIPIPPQRHFEEAPESPIDNNEDICLYAVPRKVKKNGSVRLKYHSDNCLSRINSKASRNLSAEGLLAEDYYLPSQNRVKRELSFKRSIDDGDSRIYDVPDYDNDDLVLRKDEESGETYKEAPTPKPRTKIPLGQQDDKYRSVISDLEMQIKKSVRFDDKSTEIDVKIGGEEVVAPRDDVADDVTQNLVVTKVRKDSDETAQERVNEWLDEQKKYIAKADESPGHAVVVLATANSASNVQKCEEGVPAFTYSKCDSDKFALDRNDSGYYEPPKKIRQRIPPKNIYPSSTESDSNAKSDSESCDSDKRDDVYDLYKSECRPRPLVANPAVNLQTRKNLRTSPKMQGSDKGSDFIIPRPKLIVPVHSYGVRKRRTGNLLQSRQSLSECGYQPLPNKNLTPRSNVTYDAGEELVYFSYFYYYPKI